MKLVSTFHQPTSVVYSLKCNLSSEPVEYLVQAKLNSLEVASIQPHGLQRECRWESSGGNILSVKSVSTRDGSRSNLIVLIDHPEPELVFLELKPTGLAVTKRLDLAEQKPHAEFCDHNNLVVHPDGKLAVVHCYTGKLRLVRLKRGRYDRDSDSNIMEYVVFALTFLPPRPREDYPLAILHLDHEKRRQLLVHAVDINDLDISRDVSDVLHPTCIPSKLLPFPAVGAPPPILIPVPRPSSFENISDDKEGDTTTFIGGVLVVGGSKIMLYELAGENGRVKQSNKRRRLDQAKQSEYRREQAEAKEAERQKRKRKPKATVDWPWSEVTCFCPIGEEPLRYLLGDAFGRVAMLSLHDVPNHGLILIPLGETSPPSSLTYLTNGVIFVGSHAGDSQLIRIHDEPLPSSSKAPALPTLPIPHDIETFPPARLVPPVSNKDSDIEADVEVRDCILEEQGSYLQVIQTFKNIAPIRDAVIVDTDESGHSEIVTCSGGQNTGSINIIRKGADLQQLGMIAGMPHLVNVFALKRVQSDPKQSHILLSTINTAQLLEIESIDNFVRVDVLNGGFVAERTLAAKNVLQKNIGSAIRRGGKEIQAATATYEATSFVVQVTPNGVYLLDFEIDSTWERKHEVKADSLGGGVATALEIVAADINASQIVLATGNGVLTCLEVSGNTLQTSAQKHLSVEISAICCAPFDPKANSSNIAAVAYWRTNQIQLFDLSNQRPFNEICITQSLPSVVRSLLLFDFQASGGAQPHLFAGLGNGSLAIFTWDSTLQVLGKLKLASLGALPVALTPYTLPDGRRAVLATGSRAAVLTWEHERLQVSPVMLKDAVATTQLHAEGYESSLLIANDSALFISQVRDVDSMHIRSVPSGPDVPQKIVYAPSLKVFGVTYSRSAPTRVGSEEPAVQSFFRLLDDSSLTQLSEFEPKASEEITSVATLISGEDETVLFCVGSYNVDLHESEPKSGCLRVFSAHPLGSDARSSLDLQLLASSDIPGCVYDVKTVNGLIAVGVNSSVLLFRPDINSVASTFSLQQVSRMNSNYFVTCLSSYDNRLVLGDQIASISLVETMEDLRLRTLGRDLAPLSPVCVQAVNERHILAANDTLNLLSFSFDEKTKKLDRDGYYQQSDLVNKLVPGSIASAETGSPLNPIQMFFTSSGRIGVIVDVQDDQLALHLTDLQRNMYRVVEDGDRHKRLRTPQSGARRRVGEEAYGFLDGDFLERLLSIPDSQLAEIEKGSNEHERLKRPIADFVQLLKNLQSLH
ncbi:CPSF-A domain-containing protein [Mycena indigotica]|uniref:DNA damage-binding protein 1 n=1 Tax=Mycena indigotica TaxID=2126181 RepID=A0A8H6SK02_9AGAR|nr:CPSF-A domain-containing protein [Mycena indigotica]KAF7299245.1 CPSF-A domain-containing protein [Mycena indigotica]